MLWDVDDLDLTCLQLSGSAATVLAHLVRVGERSVAQLAAETGVPASLVSRAVRDLVSRRLVEQGEGRPRTVGLSPGVAEAVVALAAEVRESAELRAAALEALGSRLAAVAPQYDPTEPRFWLVPLRADADRVEAEVRAVLSEMVACVPGGRRPRGVPRRRRPGSRVSWRVLVQDDWPQDMWVPPLVTLEVRHHCGWMPWMELLDRQYVATEVMAGGCRRIAWSSQPGQVAIALAGFERWWEAAEPVVQSTSAAQPLERATAARQRR